jgi:hypothetical protein
MDIAITPTYNDFFEGEEPSLNDLLSDIPSRFLIRIIAHLNAIVHFDKDEKSDLEIIRQLLRRQTDVVRKEIIYNYTKLHFTNNDSIVKIFTTHTFYSFYHYVFVNYKDFEREDTTPSQELNIFKAYLIFLSQSVGNIGKTNKLNASDEDIFSSVTWPLILNQLEAGIRTNPFSDFLRSAALLNQLQSNLGCEKYVEQFLKYNNVKNYWEYVYKIISAVKTGYEVHDEPKLYIKNDVAVFSIFYNLSVNIEKYKKAYQNKEYDPIGLKSTPLYYDRGQDVFVVLDWNLFASKIYEGLIFDFFENSGIKENKKYSSIPAFKKEIGFEVSEKHIFRNFIKHILPSKYAKLLFNENLDSAPDAYYRCKNRIVLFEIKDAWFPNKAITSSSFDDIKEVIDNKYNSTKKGTGQIVSQIKKMTKASFEAVSYDELKIKPRNFIIYPVIIYTDKHFGMPGISNYLIKEFKKKVDDLDLRSQFRRINDISFLNLGFLMEHSRKFREDSPIKIIEAIHQKINARKKRFQRTKEMQDLLSWSENVELTYQSIFSSDTDTVDSFEDLAKIFMLDRKTEKNFF